MEVAAGMIDCREQNAPVRCCFIELEHLAVLPGLGERRVEREIVKAQRV